MDSPESLKEHLVAIVENSDDAIITKNLDSIIQSWNKAAERLFGYTAEEAVGQSITMLIPADRQQEEVEFIAKLSRGERIHHFETIRQRKDGSFLPVSLTVSPVRDATGKIVGASKIARDISLQHQAAEQQRVLLAEMRHRVANSFAIAGSLLTVTARQVETAGDLANLMRERLMALSAAHKMAVRDPSGELSESADLRELLASIIDPFARDALREFEIEELRVAPAAITPICLVFYELGTNAVKYGALGQPGGTVSIRARRRGDRFVIEWVEHCSLAACDELRDGFGTRLSQSAVEATLGGTMSRQFDPSGMKAVIDLDLGKLTN
ncbi:PAS domain S-box protein [Thioclava atlantica]|uniref:histidine kinase n=1 Tax=Thioclava atlantica TaxID=1317124 RepID=A0A085U0E5_9RHOB|nr:PAS domain S-box protein [Thioclava atlantica]KFE36442.1 signal transduction histidine kinase [Thioclava atlantica]